MRNPLFVFWMSIEHYGLIPHLIRTKFYDLYYLLYPEPFEHWCVFCAKYVCNEWWEEPKRDV
jgi:hypothetical protein